MFAKKVKVKSLRHILASPFHLQWSNKSEAEIAPVRNALEKLLPAAKLEKKPWIRPSKHTKGVAEKHCDDSNKQQNVYRSYLAPGFQSVMRGLERKELCCIILSDEIKPTSLQKILFAYACANNVPIFVIPDLKRVTKSTLGFSTMVMGFKNIVSESAENEFHPIYRMVAENSQSVEAPFLLPQKEDSLSDQYVCKDIEKQTNNPQEMETGSPYLYRRNPSERVFVPNNNSGCISKSSSKTNAQEISDFICVEKSPKKNSALNDVEKDSMACKSYSNDDDDDTDSCDDNLFFVDNNPDESLISTERQNNQQGKMQWKNAMKKQHKKGTKQNLSLNSDKTTQKQQSTIQFRPLLVKAVTNNSKKKRTRKKKKNN